MASGSLSRIQKTVINELSFSRLNCQVCLNSKKALWEFLLIAQLSPTRNAALLVNHSLAPMHVPFQTQHSRLRLSWITPTSSKPGSTSNFPGSPEGSFSSGLSAGRSDCSAAGSLFGLACFLVASRFFSFLLRFFSCRKESSVFSQNAFTRSF